MKKIQNPLTNYTPEQKPEPDLVRPERVWLQLVELFGKSFYREHGREPSNLWVMAISKLSDEQIKIGLANLANDGLEFPANLPQFVAACKREVLAAPYWNQPKKLEDLRLSGKMSRLEWLKKNGDE